MTEHILKTDPEVFEAARSGAKTFEIRFNDRDFRVGDVLQLREPRWTSTEMRAGSPLDFTGRTLTKTVSHVLSGYGLVDGWVCLSYAQDPSPKPADASCEPPAGWQVRERLRGAHAAWQGIRVNEVPFSRCRSDRFELRALGVMGSGEMADTAQLLGFTSSAGVRRMLSGEVDGLAISRVCTAVHDEPVYAQQPLVLADGGPGRPDRPAGSPLKTVPAP
ncbi:DUF3850 domain-containing protein [Variovorax sp. LT1P1]|uniref:DUF3850 domain-containing protein n=1 Tax=Variovorax sp. LT1P1 TaxID=3443730 RepID=UPI003F478566